jgi:hypothetical protein
MEAMRRPVGKELLNSVAAMNQSSTSSDDPPTTHFIQQVLQEGHDLLRVKSMTLTADVFDPPQCDVSGVCTGAW